MKRRATSNPLGAARFNSVRGLEAMTERKNLKIDVEMYERLREEKTQYETWNHLFDRLLEEAE